MSKNVEMLLEDLVRYPSMSNAARREADERASWITTATDPQVTVLLDTLLRIDPPGADDPTQALLAVALRHLTERFRAHHATAGDVFLADPIRQRLEALYTHLTPASRTRHHLLSVLTWVRGNADLERFAELVATDPPQSPIDAALPFFPLAHNQTYDPNTLFPRLLDGLEHMAVASPILDLANCVTRCDMVSVHPAADRCQQLANLLAGIAGRLGSLETHPEKFSGGHSELQLKIHEGVALTISLCDALALIGDPSVVGQLYKVLQLGHRRLQTEAAAALARLGEKPGRKALLDLAAHASTRLRVLSYAEELDLLGEIEEAYKSPVARAESELATFLAEPTQFGIPPSEMELFDQHTQHWPGYDDPVNCYLFRYNYKFTRGTYSNIGIAGPLVHAFLGDLSNLDPDDIYAAYAGWQAEHADIYQIDVKQLTDRQRSETRRLENRLWTDGYEDVQPVVLGFFFGEKVLVATAVCDGTAGVVVVDDDKIHWHCGGTDQQSPDPQEVYCIYKGRKLLQTFNQ